jgi:hypothetical protein
MNKNKVKGILLSPQAENYLYCLKYLKKITEKHLAALMMEAEKNNEKYVVDWSEDIHQKEIGSLIDNIQKNISNDLIECVLDTIE